MRRPHLLALAIVLAALVPALVARAGDSTRVSGGVALWTTAAAKGGYESTTMPGFPVGAHLGYRLGSNWGARGDVSLFFFSERKPGLQPTGVPGSELARLIGSQPLMALSLSAVRSFENQEWCRTDLVLGMGAYRVRGADGELEMWRPGFQAGFSTKLNPGSPYFQFELFTHLVPGAEGLEEGRILAFRLGMGF
jgi:hypothetical protein